MIRSTTIVAALAACALLTPRADADVVIQGQWSYDGATGVFTAPTDTDPAAFGALLADVLSRYPAIDPEAAASFGANLTGAGQLVIRENEDGFGHDLEASNVNFNPLATGGPAGTLDIATGGDFIEAQLGRANSASTIIMSVAYAADVEHEVFRQDFGPVQGTRRANGASGDPSPGNDLVYDFVWRQTGSWGTDPFAAGANGFTENLVVTFRVAPAPGAMGAFALAGIGLGMRRRR